ncbi:MlaD family protein [Nonomuraea rubra]|uniref:MlaD family protein n=1 Tax=Nonomuraea rubra TaxID=46180 RepID=UPI00360B0E49
MRRLAAVLLAWTLLASGCSVGGAGPYLLVAIFSQAPSLYEEARVKVMGLDAGYVERIRISGDKVRVELRIDRHVPLPSGVKAVVAPQNTLGERNVVLYPRGSRATSGSRPGRRSRWSAPTCRWRSTRRSTRSPS